MPILTVASGAAGSSPRRSDAGLLPVSALARALNALSLFVLMPPSEFAYMAALLSAKATCAPSPGLSYISYGTHENDGSTPIIWYDLRMLSCPSRNSAGRPYLDTLSASYPIGLSVARTATLAPAPAISSRNSRPASPIVL